MNKPHAYRDSRDKAGQVPDCLTRQSAAEPGRTGTSPFRACPVVPPYAAPIKAVSMTHSSGSLLGRTACGGAEPRFVDLHSKYGMASRGASLARLPVSGQAQSRFAAVRASLGLLAASLTPILGVSANLLTPIRGVAA